MEDITGHIEALRSASDDRAFLIISTTQGDFLQFRNTPAGLEIDFPLITKRQRALEPRLREIYQAADFEIQVNPGTDGSRFLDIYSTAEAKEVSSLIRTVFVTVFGVEEPSTVFFQSDGVSLTS